MQRRSTLSRIASTTDEHHEQQGGGPREEALSRTTWNHPFQEDGQHESSYSRILHARFSGYGNPGHCRASSGPKGSADTTVSAPDAPVRGNPGQTPHGSWVANIIRRRMIMKTAGFTLAAPLG